MTAAIVLGAPLRKYAAVGVQALRQRLQDRAALIGRNVFLVMVLMIFFRLWTVLLGHGPAHALQRPGDFVWYMAVAEWMTLSLPPLYLEIERDVRLGDIAYHLTRPMSYLAMKLSGACAEVLLAMAVMAVTAFVTSYALTGSLPSQPLGLLAAVPLCLISSALMVLCNAAIGLSAFWLHDCAPIYWIWQKLLFVLGGLFVPLSVYPGWLRQLALWSPFSAMLNGPASLVFHVDAATFGLVALKLGGWALLLSLLSAVLYRRALRVIDLHGG